MANHSSPEYHVLPTRVRLYHRRGSGKSHPPPPPSQLRKTSTPADFTDMAFLVKTSSSGPELQFRSMSDADPGSPSGNEATDITFDLSTIRSCEFYKCKDWVVIVDSAGLCRAVEFVKDDPSSESFQERLISCTKLLKVKCSMKDTFDREKWLPISPPPPLRQLPPVPNDRPNSGHQGKYDYCETIDRRRNVPEEWPDRPAPPPPTHPTLQRERPIPPIGGNRRSPDYLDIFHNSVISVDEEHAMVPFSAPADNGIYLVPRDQRPRYENDPSRRGPQQPRVNNCIPQSKVSTSGATEWNCSACSVWNPSTNRMCDSCGEPRALYAEQLLVCIKKKGASNKTYKTSSPGTKKKFEDCKECQRINRRDSKECNECEKRPVAKSPGKNENEDTVFPPAISSKVKGTSLPDGRSKGNEEIRRRGSLDCTECERLKSEAPLTQHNPSNTRPQIKPKKKFEDCEQCQRNIHRDPSECNKCGKKPVAKNPGESENVTPSSPPSCNQCETPMHEAPPTPYKPDSNKSKKNRTPYFSPEVSSNVDLWRCQKCTVLNAANAFFCKTCEAVRDDAWQCQVCRAVISLDVAQCRRCDVWKCHLCTFQNDSRENRSKFCKQCNQPR